MASQLERAPYRDHGFRPDSAQFESVVVVDDMELTEAPTFRSAPITRDPLATLAPVYVADIIRPYIVFTRTIADDAVDEPIDPNTLQGYEVDLTTGAGAVSAKLGSGSHLGQSFIFLDISATMITLKYDDLTGTEISLAMVVATVYNFLYITDGVRKGWEVIRSW